MYFSIQLIDHQYHHKLTLNGSAKGSLHLSYLWLGPSWLNLNSSQIQWFLLFEGVFKKAMARDIHSASAWEDDDWESWVRQHRDEKKILWILYVKAAVKLTSHVKSLSAGVLKEQTVGYVESTISFYKFSYTLILHNLNHPKQSTFMVTYSSRHLWDIKSTQRHSNGRDCLNSWATWKKQISNSKQSNPSSNKLSTREMPSSQTYVSIHF